MFTVQAKKLGLRYYFINYRDNSRETQGSSSRLISSHVKTFHLILTFEAKSGGHSKQAIFFLERHAEQSCSIFSMFGASSTRHMDLFCDSSSNCMISCYLCTLWISASELTLNTITNTQRIHTNTIIREALDLAANTICRHSIGAGISTFFSLWPDYDKYSLTPSNGGNYQSHPRKRVCRTQGKCWASKQEYQKNVTGFACFMAMGCSPQKNVQILTNGPSEQILFGNGSLRTHLKLRGCRNGWFLSKRKEQGLGMARKLGRPTALVEASH